MRTPFPSLLLPPLPGHDPHLALVTLPLAAPLVSRPFWPLTARATRMGPAPPSPSTGHG